MTTRTLTAHVPAPPATVLRHLADDTAYPDHASDLVSVTEAGDGAREWVLRFRGGTASWSQATRTPDDAPHRIEFVQLRGDFQHLLGSWTCTERPDGCEVTYDVSFGTSVPHLAGAIDSAAGRVLVRVAHDVLTAVAGPVRVTAGGHHLRDPELPHPRSGATTSGGIRHG
ncbi:hypothetical protein GCM10028784_20390 [Myceligenerans cantabricum]